MPNPRPKTATPTPVEGAAAPGQGPPGEPPRACFRRRQQRAYFRALLWLAGWLFRLVAGPLFRLMPSTTIGPEVFDRVQARDAKAIVVPWHCIVPYGLWMTRSLGVAVMASRSNAGAVAAAIVGRMGGFPVRGGSRDGGAAALLEIVGHLRAGRWAVIVADAPRGPAHVCKIGPILAAHRSGLPIVPVAFSARRKWVLNTWDRTIIPKPFSPVVWIWAPPFRVDGDLDRAGLETRRRELERVLREVQERADRFWDRRQGTPRAGRFVFRREIRYD